MSKKRREKRRKETVNFISNNTETRIKRIGSEIFELFDGEPMILIRVRLCPWEEGRQGGMKL